MGAGKSMKKKAAQLDVAPENSGQIQLKIKEEKLTPGSLALPLWRGSLRDMNFP